jgi:hypothetical protein
MFTLSFLSLQPFIQCGAVFVTLDREKEEAVKGLDFGRAP